MQLITIVRQVNLCICDIDLSIEYGMEVNLII